jgi:hypothetical protein
MASTLQETFQMLCKGMHAQKNWSDTRSPDVVNAADTSL